MFPNKTLALAERVIASCRRRKLRLATAESCTGGLIAGCLSAVAGASDVLSHGFVTYANQAKTDLLGVPEKQLLEHGAVSEAVSRAMAEGAIAGPGADVAVSVTGIAGPGGGSPGKPVGLVHMAVAGARPESLHQRHVFAGDRGEVRLQAVEAALSLLLEGLDQS